MTPRTILRRFLALALILSSVPAAFAAHTETIIDDSVDQFSSGDLTTSTLTWQGVVKPPRERQLLSTVDADVVWDAVRDDKDVYIATGHEGQLFVKHRDDTIALRHDFDETELYSITEHDGKLLVAASPGGTIYRLKSKGDPEVFARTGANIAWDMVETKKQILVATGTPAGIVSIDDRGTTSSLVKMPQVLNVLDLATIPDSEDIAVATQGPGLIGRVSPEGKMKVLLDPEQEEVRRVAVMPDGSIIGAVNGVRSPGEKLLDRTPDAGKKGGNGKPRPASYLARIRPDGYAEEWWTAPESPIHDIAAMPDGTVIVSAGSNGRVFEVTADGNTNFVGITTEQYVTRLAPAKDDELLLGTGQTAAVYTLKPLQFVDGVYESRVLDAKGVVGWMRLTGVLDPGHGSIDLLTRTGNTAKPDDTWSDWTKTTTFADGTAKLNGAVARFLQYRLQFGAAKHKDDSGPSVDLVRAFYVRPNTAPAITEFNVTEPGNKSVAPGDGRVFSDPNSAPQNLEMNWKAADPDNDTLEYALYLTDIGSRDYRLVQDKLTDAKYTLETRAIADGEYRAKLVASDAPANAPKDARTAEKESAPFLIDNTAPEITIAKVDRKKSDNVLLDVEAKDAASLIASLGWKANIDDEFQPVLTEDDLFDQKVESFRISVTGDAAAKGSVITIAASDEAGNTSIVKVTLD